MASTITLDGQLTGWTSIDCLDFGMTGLNGSKTYGRLTDETYYFAIEISALTIGTGDTLWLNTDRNEATGYDANLPSGIWPNPNLLDVSRPGIPEHGSAAGGHTASQSTT